MCGNVIFSNPKKGHLRSGGGGGGEGANAPLNETLLTNSYL